MNKGISFIVLFSLLFSTAAVRAADEDVSYRLAVIAQQDALPWYERMRQGVDAFAVSTGHEAFLIAPATADAAEQAALVESMLADQAQAICLIPVDIAVCEPALAAARQQGIVIIIHNAPGATQYDLRLEPFENASAAGTPAPLRSGYIEWEQASANPNNGTPAYDPAALAYAMLSAAVRLVDGLPVGEGTDLGVAGYTNVRADPADVATLYGSALIYVGDQPSAVEESK